MAKKKGINWKDHFVNLIVVIIGISAAFALNNWKEDRKSQSLEKQYLRSLKAEVDSDIKQLQEAYDTSLYFLRMNDKLLDLMQRRDYENDSLFFYLLSLYSYAEITPVNNTFESLKASGNFELIKGFELKKEITTLYNQHYANLITIDGFHRDHVQQISSHLNRNVQFTGRPIIMDAEFMKETYFINMAYTSKYILASKIETYGAALKHALYLRDTSLAEIETLRLEGTSQPAKGL